MPKPIKQQDSTAASSDTGKAIAARPDTAPQRRPHIGARDAPPVQEWEYMYPVALLSLAAAASPISQMTLAPVYGSIPSAANHASMCSISLLTGFIIRAVAGELKKFQPLRWLQIWTFSVPAIQAILSPYSQSLDLESGPILNSYLSCHVILNLTGFVLADFASRYKQTAMLATRVGFTASYMIIGGLLAFVVYPILEDRYAGIVRWTPELFEEKFEINPIHMQLALGAAYAVLAPSWYTVLGLPGIIHSVYFNPHFSNEKASASLANHNWTILDRQWSNTGYISVLEGTVDQYRVMRADHSLLGGEWLLTPARVKENWKTKEPIYSVFSMLESVRLLKQDVAPVPDTSAKALVIGLGIGTAPKAMLAHGIDTTIVELDPVVHKFAVGYFDLPTNHTAVLRDAVVWVKQRANAIKAVSSSPESDTSPGDSTQAGPPVPSPSLQQYDYIIHDVFTGGAEPLSLFTTSFLHNLRTLLTPHGTIALNYAGDLSLPLTRLVLRTIGHTFAGHCKIFRDSAPEKPTEDEDKNGDFLNMVLFCRNTPGPIAFRPPIEADYLESLSRKHFMLPKAELEIPFPAAEAVGDDGNTDAAKGLLYPGDETKWKHEQLESAKRHWRIMRKVMPDVVWEGW